MQRYQGGTVKVVIGVLLSALALIAVPCAHSQSTTKAELQVSANVVETCQFRTGAVVGLLAFASGVVDCHPLSMGRSGTRFVAVLCSKVERDRNNCPPPERFRGSEIRLVRFE